MRLFILSQMKWYPWLSQRWHKDLHWSSLHLHLSLPCLMTDSHMTVSLGWLTRLCQSLWIEDCGLIRRRRYTGIEMKVWEGNQTATMAVCDHQYELWYVNSWFTLSVCWMWENWAGVKTWMEKCVTTQCNACCCIWGLLYRKIRVLMLVIMLWLVSVFLSISYLL